MSALLTGECAGIKQVLGKQMGFFSAVCCVVSALLVTLMC